MSLRHATPTRNIASIRKRGLLTCKSQCKQPVVWLHSPSRSAWAVLHVMKRHGCTKATVVEVYIPRSWLTRSRTGLWYTKRDVPATHIGTTIPVEEDQ